MKIEAALEQVERIKYNMNNIKIEYPEITGLVSAMVASGLPMDSGNLHFEDDWNALELTWELFENKWKDLSKAKGIISYKGIELQDNSELIGVLLFDDWEVKDDALFSEEFGDTISNVAEIVDKMPKVDAQRAFDIIKRCSNLGKSEVGSGHSCFLKGIQVSINLTAPQYFWLQWERYHFQDTISSQSTMHRLDKGKSYNQFVSNKSIEQVETLIEMYHTQASADEYADLFGITPMTSSERFQAIISNMPEGIMLTRRVTLNYLQLVSMVVQREQHKLPEWREFCDWAKQLPMFSLLTGEE